MEASNVIGEKAKEFIIHNEGADEPLPYPERVGLARILAAEFFFSEAGMLLAPGRLEKKEGFWFWTLESGSDGVLLCPAEEVKPEELLSALEALYRLAREGFRDLNPIMKTARDVLVKAGVKLD